MYAHICIHPNNFITFISLYTVLISINKFYFFSFFSFSLNFLDFPFQWFRKLAAFVDTNSNAVSPFRVCWAAVSRLTSARAAWSGRAVWTKTSNPKIRTQVKWITQVSTKLGGEPADYKATEESINKKKYKAQ